MSVVNIEYGPAGQKLRTVDITGSTVTVRDGAGNVTSTRPATPLELTVVQDAAADANGRAIRDQVRSAIAANRAYLALASPSNAQNAAQLKALTQQIIHIERLLGDVLDGVD